MSEYELRAGDRAYVVEGPHTGSDGRVDFIDLPRDRALVDFGGGRKGGLTWVSLSALRPPSGMSLWSPLNPRTGLGVAPYNAHGHAEDCNRVKPMRLPAYFRHADHTCIECGQVLTWPLSEAG